jgi:hypothetical protein
VLSGFHRMGAGVRGVMGAQEYVFDLV